MDELDFGGGLVIEVVEIAVLNEDNDISKARFKRSIIGKGIKEGTVGAEVVEQGQSRLGVGVGNCEYVGDEDSRNVGRLKEIESEKASIGSKFLFFPINGEVVKEEPIEVEEHQISDQTLLNKGGVAENVVVDDGHVGDPHLLLRATAVGVVKQKGFFELVVSDVKVV